MSTPKKQVRGYKRKKKGGKRKVVDVVGYERKVKKGRAKRDVSKLLSIPEKNSVVIPVKVGPSLKEAVELVSDGNVSGWVRDAIKQRLTREHG